jgi:hypothetical protein
LGSSLRLRGIRGDLGVLVGRFVEGLGGIPEPQMPTNAGLIYLAIRQVRRPGRRLEDLDFPFLQLWLLNLVDSNIPLAIKSDCSHVDGCEAKM